MTHAPHFRVDRKTPRSNRCAAPFPLAKRVVNPPNDMILAALLVLSGPPVPSSRTVLKAFDLHREAPVRAFVNEKFVGVLTRRQPIDVSDLVKRGRNTLTLRWRAPMASLGVAALFGPTNRLGVVSRISLSSSSDPVLRKAGSKTFFFQIPASPKKS